MAKTPSVKQESDYRTERRYESRARSRPALSLPYGHGDEPSGTRVYGKLLKADIAGELEHAVFLADKIAALGGDVKIDVTMPKRVKSAKQMMDMDIQAERKVIGNYATRIEQAEAFGDRGLVIRLEDILAEEDRPRRGARALETVISC